MTDSELTKILDNLRWNNDGLIPAIAQDHQTNDILMLAWMNRESLELSLQEKRAIYWSRSRQQLWRKGEESGHVQHLKEILIDCDADAIVLKVDQVGGIACHTGRKSCFFQELDKDGLKIIAPVLKDPKEIY